MFPKKNKKGICFSGGGIKGFAHIGVIKALEENNITFDMVSGNSAGSIVGACYALGISANEMLNYCLNLKIGDIVNYKKRKNSLSDIDFDSPRDAINSIKNLNFSPAINSENIQDFFVKLAGDKSFSDTKIPFYAVCTDLRSGKEVLLSEGKLGIAVRASSAIPGVFTPVITKDMTMVDGMLVNNMPANILREKGMNRVLSVNLKEFSKPGTDSVKYFDMLMASIDIMAAQTIKIGKDNSDLVICPYLNEKLFPNSKDSNFVKYVYNLGYEEAIKNMDKIKKLFG